MKKILLDEKTKIWISVAAVVVISVAILIFVCINLKGQDSEEEALTVGNVEVTDTENVSDVEIYSKENVEGRLLNSLSYDFTDDGCDDTLEIYYSGLDYEGDSDYTKALLSGQGKVAIYIFDGEKQSTLYFEEFTCSEAFSSVAAVVNYSGHPAIFTGNSVIGENSSSFSFEVTDLAGKEINVVDSLSVDFVTSSQGALDCAINNKNIYSAAEVLPDFREVIEKYYASSKLLVNLSGTSTVEIPSSKDSATLKEAYESVFEAWDNSAEYSCENIDNIFGKSGYMVIEDLSLSQFVVYYYFYDSQGKELLSTFGDTYLRDFDGDGAKEVISNRVYSDGGQLVKIYSMLNDKVMIADASGLLSKDLWNTEAYWTMAYTYDYDENVVNIDVYSDDIGDFKSYKKEVDLSKLSFEEDEGY